MAVVVSVHVAVDGWARVQIQVLALVLVRARVGAHVPIDVAIDGKSEQHLSNGVIARVRLCEHLL